mgnify:CR=1 FL=1
MSEYTPDRWVVLEFVTPQETIRKVFAGWYGGFAGSDTWQLNSGITQIREKDGVFEFDGYSGSTYYCAYNSYGMNSYMYAVLQNWVNKAEKDSSIEINIIQLDDIVAKAH